MTLITNILASYDDSDPGASDPPAPAPFTDPPAATPPAAPPAADPPSQPPAGEKTFSQEDLNRILAEDRRKHQEKYQSLDSSYQELLKNQNLTTEERDRLQKDYEELQARHRTKEQQAAHERKLYEEAKETELKEFREAATLWETRFTESTINQALQGAAIKHEAWNPDQVIVHLRGKTELVDEKDSQGNVTGNLVPMVNMTVLNEDTGVSEKLMMTPDEAVEYMKKTQEHYNFFKNNIREGIGSPNATGGANTGPNGTVDHTRLTDDQWFKLRKENPAALGLERKRR